MTKLELTAKLERIFKEVFNNPNIKLTEELTAHDVESWDSLSHMLLLTEIEDELNVKFKLKELSKMNNVGDLIEIILSKL